MARRDKYGKLQDKELAAVLREIDALYDELANTIGFIGATGGGAVDKQKPFVLSDYPSLKKRVDKALERLAKRLDLSIVNGVRSQWTLANKANDELCRTVFGDYIDKLTKEQKRRYFNNNDKALAAFLTRKDNGLSLSQKVWNYAEETKGEIESTLELGIKTGEDAGQMARNLKEYLRFPDKLFRRVRDEEGNLHLSKNAAAFHPGQGVYRSSYKNARRLAATETNMAYSSADYLRYNQLDFIVGFTVHLSNNHTCLDSKGVPRPFHDICNELKGDYPRWFKFVGWHPQCRCYTTTILKTPEEVMRDSDGVDRGSVNEVKTVPPQFTDWVERNEARIERAEDRGTLPYFLRDNEWAWKEGAEMPAVPMPKTALLKAEERHAARTPEQIADIKARWTERAIAYNDAELVLRLADSIPDLDAYWRGAKDESGDSLAWMAERLKALRYEFNTGKVRSYDILGRHAGEVLSYIKDLRDKLEYLDGPLKVMQKWGAEKAKLVQDNVLRTMKKYDSLSDKAKIEKYRFEAKWIEENRKGTIPTWKEAQDAYLKAAKELEWKIEWEALTDRLDTLARNPMANPTLVETARQYIGKDKARAEAAIDDVEDTIRLETAKAKFNRLFKEHPKLLATFKDSMDLALAPDDAERVLSQAKVFRDAWADMEMRGFATKDKIPAAMWEKIQAARDADDYPELTKRVEEAENYIALEKFRNKIRTLLQGDSGDIIENYNPSLAEKLRNDLMGATTADLPQVELHIREADNIIDEWKDRTGYFNSNYVPYDTKSPSYNALVQDGFASIKDRDLRGLKAVLEKLRTEKERLERDKKYAEEREAEWKRMKDYVNRVIALGVNDAVLDSLIASFMANEATKKVVRLARADVEAIKARLATLGLSISGRKTLEDLRRELGGKLPKTLEKLDVSIAKYERSSKMGSAARDNAAEIEETMFEWLNKYDLGMNIKESVLEPIRTSWFKCQFETGTGEGHTDDVGDLRIEQGAIPTGHARLRAAHEMFLGGTPVDSAHQLKRKEYEKYGNLMNTDIHSSLHNNHGRSYGPIQVRFKRDTVIATWTPSDSLGKQYQPTLVTDPKACGFDDREKYRLPLGMKGADYDKLFSKAISGYCELQYHGDLTMDCVESLSFPYDISKRPSTLAEAKKWKALGIKVYYLDSNDKLVEL